MALSTASRKLVSTRTVTSTPSTTTTAMACCQLSPRPRMRVKATMAFKPSPEARASGKFATRPIAMQATAAATHVAKNTAEYGEARTLGTQYRRVDEDDVGHRHKGGQPGHHLRP